MTETMWVVNRVAIFFMVIIFASNILQLVDGVIHMYNTIWDFIRKSFKM